MESRLLIREGTREVSKGVSEGLDTIQKAIPPLKTLYGQKDEFQPYACRSLLKAYLLTGELKEAQNIIPHCGLGSTESKVARARAWGPAAGQGHSEKAIAAWKDLLAKRSKGTPFWEAHAQLVRLYEDAGDSKQVMKHRKRLFIRWPHTPEGKAQTAHLNNEDLTRGELENRAQQLWDVRMYEEAYKTYDDTRKYGDLKDHANLMMGRLLSERLRDKYPTAIQHFEACSSAKDRELAGTCLYKKGIALGKIRDYKGAVATLRDFRKRYPDNRNRKEAGFEIGRHLMEAGHFKKATKHLEKWVHQEKGLKDKNKYLWFAAWAAYRGELYDDAIRILAPLRKSGRTLVGDKALYWSGMAHLRAGRAAKGKKSLSRCVDRFPLSYYTWLAMDALDFPADHPRRAFSFEEISPVDDSPWQVIEALSPAQKKSLSPVLVPILTGDIVDAQDRWKDLKSRKRVKNTLGKKFSSVTDALLVLLESHYPTRKQAYKKHRKVRSQWPTSGSVQQWRALFPRAFRALVKEAATKEGLPEWLIYSHMLQESRYGTHMISGANARGVLQILPSTARKIASDIGVPYEESWLYDAGYNIRLAAWYLGALNRLFMKQTPLASASYNGGPLLLSFHMKQYPTLEMPELIEALPTHQARNYVRKVIEHLHRYLAIYASSAERDSVMRSLFPAALNRTEGNIPNY